MPLTFNQPEELPRELLHFDVPCLELRKAITQAEILSWTKQKLPGRLLKPSVSHNWYIPKVYLGNLLLRMPTKL